MNMVVLEPVKNSVKLELARIQSEFHYAHPGQVVEETSERK